MSPSFCGEVKFAPLLPQVAVKVYRDWCWIEMFDQSFERTSLPFAWDFRYVSVVQAGCGDRRRSNRVESKVLLDALVADSYLGWFNINNARSASLPRWCGWLCFRHGSLSFSGSHKCKKNRSKKLVFGNSRMQQSQRGSQSQKRSSFPD
jgi:hypothetical protein